MSKETPYYDRHALTRKTHEWLYDNVPKDSLIVEFGSGRGSIMLAEYGYHVITIENDPAWLYSFQHENLRYIFAGLVNVAPGVKWYDPKRLKLEMEKIKDEVDFLILDGPNEIGEAKRHGVLYCLDCLPFIDRVSVLIDDTTEGESGAGLDQGMKTLYGLSERLNRPYELIQVAGKKKMAILLKNVKSSSIQ